MFHLVKVMGLLFLPLVMIPELPAATSPMTDEHLFSLLKNDTIPYLNIPRRRDDAWGAAEFASQIADLSIIDREKAVIREILSGNVPAFSRNLKPVKVTEVIKGKRYTLVFFVTLDYLAIGSDEDYLYIPMTPSTAQYLASQLDCVLPTKKMVDIIYHRAGLKLRPQPIAPSDSMTTVPVFKQHTDSIKHQIRQLGFDRVDDQMLAGHKKDIIISNEIYRSKRAAGSVVIYGWHLGENKPIQPVYNGHHARYADYSHGVRLIAQAAYLQGEPIPVDRLLQDESLSVLLSNEGMIHKSTYPETDLLLPDQERN
jgi:hypothetical protein